MTVDIDLNNLLNLRDPIKTVTFISNRIEIYFFSQ